MSELSSFDGREPPSLELEKFYQLKTDECDRLAKLIESTQQVAGSVTEHPFFGVCDLDLQPTDLKRLENELTEAERTITALLEKASRMASELSRCGPVTISEAKRLIALLDRAGSATEGVEALAPVFLAQKGDPTLGEALEKGRAGQELWDKWGENFVEAAWSAPIDDIRLKISKGVGSFWSRIIGGYRGACQEFSTLLTVSLPAGPEERLAMVDRLFSLRRHRADLARNEGLLSTALGEAWRGEQTDFRALVSVWVWMESLAAIDAEITAETAQQLAAHHQDGAELGAELAELVQRAESATQTVIDRLQLDANDAKDLDARNLPNLRDRFGRMRASLDRYDEWKTYRYNADELKSADLSSLLDALESGQLPGARAVDEFRYALAEARWAHAREVRPELNELVRTDRHQLVRNFCALDKQRFSDVQKLILAQHLGQLPTGAGGEMGFIRGEIGKKRAHKPIRQLIYKAANMVRRIKPVFLMSPISVAQFLPPEEIEFDMLVIDEASQVRPEDAIGAIARVGQIVVVGDQKQLPPTKFFERLTDNEPDEDEDEGEEEIEGVMPGTAKVTDMESILTLCEARGIRSSMLEWHYRSRCPSLIRVSNEEFYDSRLILPPSPRQEDASCGLEFTRVPGVYSSKNQGGGRPGTNRIEAEEIATALAAHAVDRPKLSIGVVAFSKSQSDMITEVLEVRRREDAVLDAFLREDKAENVFVKNIENVQGDERDVILISVGYGPHEKGGRLASMRFGPVNADGGERRLNVLFTPCSCALPGLCFL